MLYKRLIGALLPCLILLQVSGQLSKSSYEWTHLGPFVTPETTIDSGRWCGVGMAWIESLYVSDDKERILAGHITNGLFLSEDGGEHWRQIFDLGLRIGVLDIAVDGKEIFIATGLTHYNDDFGLGVYCSRNKGRTWKPTGLTFKPQDKTPIWGIDILERSKSILAISPTKIYLSTNRAKDWDVMYEDKSLNLRHIAESKDGKTILVSGRELLISNNQGEAWTQITSSLSQLSDESGPVQRIAICADPHNSARFLAAYSYKGRLWLDESKDSGKTWANVHNTRTINRFDINHAELHISPANPNEILIGAVRVFISTETEPNFKLMSTPAYQTPQFVHDDIRSVYYHKDGTCYLGTDGGVFTSSDQGNTWTNITGYGMTGVMVYGLGLTGEGFMIGCQDVGTMKYSNGEWTHLGEIYGDGGDILEMEDKVYIMVSGNARAVNKTTSEPIYVNEPPAKMTPFTAKYGKYPGSKDSLLYLGDQLWLYNGKSWKNLTEGLDNKGYKASCFTLNSAHPEIMYFAFDQPTWGSAALSGKFFRTYDGGEHWTDITESLPILNWRYVSSVVSNPQNPAEVYVSLGLMDDSLVNKVYRSLDGGDTWENWSDGISIHNSFKIQWIEGSQSGLLVSTLDGIYFRNQYQDQWVKLDYAFPAIAVRDFEIDYNKKIIYVSTYGSGVYSLKLDDELWRD
ncbi:hypothetical protein GYB22_02620 [bacterium]|nr:hypothetical protein [bacterium]